MAAQLVLIGALGASYAAAQSFVSDPLIDKNVPYTAIVRHSEFCARITLNLSILAIPS